MSGLPLCSGDEEDEETRHRPLIALTLLAGLVVPVACFAGARTEDSAVLDRGEERPLAEASAERYRPVEADTVEIQVRDRVSVPDLAQVAGSFYREIKSS